MSEDTHEIRELKFRLKQLAKQNGKQGETIHRLRAELAEVRDLNSKIERGELRRMERAIRCMSDEILRLHEKLQLDGQGTVEIDPRRRVGITGMTK